MATTTTNYGFDVPTSSDLVKNGATAISTLGQDLDTFLFRPFTRNGVLNSGMNVWQRGTSIAVAASSNPYTCDRWKMSLASGASYTVSRQATNDTTNLPFIQYCARVQRDSGQTGVNANYFIQGIETVNSIPFAGKSVTFSFYARKGANFSAASDVLTFLVAYGTGTDQDPAGAYTGQANAINTTATLTTTWQRFTATATMPATATEIKTFFTYTPVGTAGANDYFEVTGVQLEVGNQASPYAPANATIQGELAACQRYYYRTTALSAYANLSTSGYATGTTTGVMLTQFPVTMRTTPAAIETTGTAANYALLSATGSIIALSAVPAFDGNSNTQIGAFSAGVASGLVAGDATQLRANNATTAYLAWSAEL
jgi:hypothetical protein